MYKTTPNYTRFVARLIVFFWLASLVMSSQAQTLTAPQAYRQMQAGKLVLVDVRTPKEWLTSGVPAGAQLANMQDPGFLHQLKRLEKRSGNKPIALICQGGVRTAKLVKVLEQYGFRGLLDVSEGMKGSDAGPGWLARGLPLEDYSSDDPTLEAGPLSFFERLRLARLPDWDPLPQD